jgi:hypothetical protein
MSENEREEWILVVEGYNEEFYPWEWVTYVISSKQIAEYPETEQAHFARYYDSWYETEEAALDQLEDEDEEF